MADRYWVGGTASWDGTAGTKWSVTSGGSGGAAIPTSSDDVFFNAASGASVVTIATGNTGAKSINCTGFTGTLTGTGALTVSGSITLVSGMTITYTGSITFNATGTIMSAGKTFGNISINGAGITVDLADALNITGNLTISTGTFVTNNFNVTISSGGFFSTGTNTRSINLGSSTITCSAAAAINLTSTGQTFNAGTSLFILTSAGANITGGGLTFNNVSFTSETTGSVRTVTGANIFNNLSVTGPSAAGVITLNFSDRQTINGTLSTTGTAGNRRVWFRSTTYGVSQVLVVNSAASLTDADFRDIIVTGTAAPISGTRMGDLRGCTGITFSAPKTVFRIGTGNWSADQWAATSGGGVNTDNFPLAQDTAFINESTTAGTLTFDTAVPYCGSINASLRTSAYTISFANVLTIYGNVTLGSGITVSGGATVTFSGRGTQTITSVGKAFTHGITIDSFGGSVELADALTTSGTLQIDNGTFDSKGFNVSTTGSGNFATSGANPRTVNFTSSTVAIGGNFTVTTATAVNFTFIATGSTITMNGPSETLTATGLQFNNVNFNNTSGSFTVTIAGGVNTFNNLTFVGPANATSGPSNVVFSANQTITGTLTVTGPSLIRRNFLASNTIGTRRTITVNALAGNNCDFRDIEIAGAAAGTSLTGAGDCGNNIGLVFPAPKTVYWNLAGNLTWADTGWASSSGGTPDFNNWPLAQDTAIIDNTSLGTSISASFWNIGTIDTFTRNTAFTLTLTTVSIYKDMLLGGGITMASTGSSFNFASNTTSTFTSNGVTVNQPISIIGTGTVQLLSSLALASTRTLTLTRGKFDAGIWNVTTGLFASTGSNTRELIMGSGIWSLTGTGTVWNIATTNLTFNPQTADIILTDTSTTARTFTGGGLYYNKLTIGGSTGISTTTITGNNTFGELASTKTVAHTIALGATIQTFGKWTVTGTVGNVVTLTGTGASHSIAGAATSGIDYLVMGSIGFAAASPGEFYAGVNSTGTAAAPVFRTAPPAARTLYWVGGTGNWSSTTKWSTSSGGASLEAIPTSLDNVVFDSLSNATAYTATLNVVARCNQLTIAGPASGNLTMDGSGVNSLIVHGNTVFPATGFTRLFTSSIVLSGSTTGKTFTSNGVGFFSFGSGTIVVNGVGASWSMTDALNLGANDNLNLINGTFNTNNFTLTVAIIAASTAEGAGKKTLNLGSSTVTMAGSGLPISFGTTATQRNLFTFNAGTSQININQINISINGNSLTFYNMSMTASVGAGSYLINGINTFNNLTFGVPDIAGTAHIVLNDNTIVTGILTFTAGADATFRHFVRSSVLGTTMTITCASLAAASDVDFRDITFAGAASPISGTRFGDCKGNSGITFPSPKTVYWNLAGGGIWESTAWATSSGGTPNINNFPLAQDTAIIENTGLNTSATITMSSLFNICSVNMSSRTTAMTFTSSTAYTIYGNLTFGSGTTISGSSTVTFSGRTTQTLTTAGKSYTMSIIINSPGGSVTLQDSLTFVTDGITVFSLVTGTFDTNSFNVTSTGSSSQMNLSGTLSKTVVIGSETWTFAASGAAWTANAVNTTISGTRTGTFNFTSASAKTFGGGGLDYGNITINNGGAGALAISGNNTLGNITATRTATSAATISLGTTIQNLAQFSGSGQAGRLLTVTGTSATSPATLIFTGSGVATTTAVDYLTLIGLRAFPTTNAWYAGDNSITTTSTGTLGWIYTSIPVAVTSGNFLIFVML